MRKARKKQRVLKDHFEGAPDSLLREFWKALQRMVSEHCMMRKLQEAQYCIQVGKIVAQSKPG